MPPRISSYNGENTNAMEVQVAGISYFFSYSTCVAFRDSNGLHISENVWGVTTGKHLNLINGNHALRIPYPQFQRELAEAEARL